MARFKEPLKTVLIVLLLISAVLMAVRGGFFTGFLPQKDEAVSGEEQPSAARRAVLEPWAAAVTGEDGLRCGYLCDPEEITELYASIGPVLAEVLGSASQPETISEAQWQQLLCGENVWLDFGFPVPAETAVGDPESGRVRFSDVEFRELMLAKTEDGGLLLCYTAGNGEYESCTSAGLWSDLTGLAAAGRPNGARFAFEYPELSELRPDALIPGTAPVLAEAAFTVEQEPAAETLAELTGFSPAGRNRYAEADGTVVYLQEGATLRLRPDGSLDYTADAGPGPASSAEPASALAHVQELLDRVHESYAGAETLRVSGLTRSADGTVLAVDFAYYLYGAPVRMEEAYAHAELRYGVLTSLTLLPLRCTPAEEASALLPAVQAAAIAADRGHGTGILPVYVPSGGRLLPCWSAE